MSMSLVIEETILFDSYYCYYSNKLPKKFCAAFSVLYTISHIITTIMYCGDLFGLIVMMMISMVSFSDQLNCLCEICLELDLEQQE
jgi:hypothetical protein